MALAEDIRTQGDLLYEEDFFAWTQKQGRLLRQSRPAGIDWENVAEEIETLGRSERNAVRSRAIRLMQHLLKWLYQPSRRSRSWEATVREQRKQLLRLLRENPSLKNLPAAEFSDLYDSARNEAEIELDEELSRFPDTPPFTIHEVLDETWLPEDTSGQAR